MAIRTQTATRFDLVGQDTRIISWAGLLNGDSGDPFELAGARIGSVQVLGTFGAGGTVLLEGSNDGTTYATLSNQAGTAISHTTAVLKTPVETPRYVRPRVSAGDGTTDLTAILLVQR